MQAIRKIITKEDFKNFEIPQELGDKFEIILLPIKNEELKIQREEQNHKKYQEKNILYKNVLSEKSKDIWSEEKENELFLASIYDAVIQENDKEDKIWSKYL